MRLSFSLVLGLLVFSCSLDPKDTKEGSSSLESGFYSYSLKFFNFQGKLVLAGLNPSVAGNSTYESMNGYFPTVPGRNLKFYSFDQRKRISSDQYTSGKLQIKFEPQRYFEGQLVSPVDFVKNHRDAYWGPGLDQNLRWNVVPNTQGSAYFWAKGDQRYNRLNPVVQLLRKFVYNSLEAGKPPYILFPATLQPNPGNNGFANMVTNRHLYYSCESNSGSDCSVAPRAHQNSWVVNVRNAQVYVPALGGWRAAKWVEYVEVSLPGNYNDGVTSPYSNDRNYACRTDANGNYYYTGVREDWFFVKDVGPVMMLVRHINNKGGVCVYDAAREPLNFDNAHNVNILMQVSPSGGFDPAWNF